jgi:hypothetical protein
MNISGKLLEKLQQGVKRLEKYLSSASINSIKKSPFVTTDELLVAPYSESSGVIGDS